MCCMLLSCSPLPRCLMNSHAVVVQMLQQRAQAEPSATCQAVSYALHAMGVQHSCHVLSPDGSCLAYILLPQHKIALLLEGRSGYVVNTGQRRGVQVKSFSC